MMELCCNCANATGGPACARCDLTHNNKFVPVGDPPVTFNPRTQTVTVTMTFPPETTDDEMAKRAAAFVDAVEAHVRQETGHGVGDVSVEIVE